MDAIRLDMTNVGVVFKILEPGENPRPGYTKPSGHIVYDVKMDVTRKGRWVKYGHRTPNPETSSYAGVVSRESIRIMLTHADLHGLPKPLQPTFVTRTSKLQHQRNTSLCANLNLE